MGIFNLFKGGKSDKVNANKNSTFLTFDDVTIDTLVKNSVKIKSESLAFFFEKNILLNSLTISLE